MAPLIQPGPTHWQCCHCKKYKCNPIFFLRTMNAVGIEGWHPFGATPPGPEQIRNGVRVPGPPAHPGVMPSNLQEGKTKCANPRCGEHETRPAPHKVCPHCKPARHDFGGHSGPLHDFTREEYTFETYVHADNPWTGQGQVRTLCGSWQFLGGGVVRPGQSYLTYQDLHPRLKEAIEKGVIDARKERWREKELKKARAREEALAKQRKESREKTIEYEKKRKAIEMEREKEKEREEERATRQRTDDAHRPGSSSGHATGRGSAAAGVARPSSRSGSGASSNAGSRPGSSGSGSGSGRGRVTGRGGSSR